MKINKDNEITDIAIANSCLCSKLRATSRSVSRVYDLALKPVGIKSNQMTILIAVSLMGPASITRLSQQLSMERTTLTRNLRPLVAANLLQKTDGHGRTRELTLTEQGREMLDKAKPLWDRAQQQLIKQLGEDSSIEISSLLKQILDTNIVK